MEVGGSQRNLPLELLDMIFGYLAESRGGISGRGSKVSKTKSDLAACSLVCRAWQAAAQPFLFKDFKCTLHVTIPCFERFVHPANLKLDSLVTFLQASPTICTCIRRLEINMYTEMDGDPTLALEGYFGPREPESCPVRLMKILRLLTRLESASFSNISPNLMIPPLSFAKIVDLPIVPHLDTLHLDFGHRMDNAASVYKINALFAYFGHVRHLEIEDLEIVEERDFYPEFLSAKHEHLVAYRANSEIPTYCSFESISLHNVRNSSPLLLAFANMPKITKLQSLQLGCMFSGGSGGLTSLMRAVSDNLKRLQFRAECTPSVNALDLSSCNVLECLKITFPMLTHTGKLSDARIHYTVPNDLPLFLLSAPPTLTTVVFHLELAKSWAPQLLTRFDAAVRGIEDAIVELVDQRGLQSVVVECDRNLGLAPGSREDSMDLLSRINERGVLRFC